MASISFPRAYPCDGGQTAPSGVGVTLLFGEVRCSIRNDQPHGADAGLVAKRVIDLVAYPVTHCEPDTALVADGSSNAALGTGCPAHLISGSAWRELLRTVKCIHPIYSLSV